VHSVLVQLCKQCFSALDPPSTVADGRQRRRETATMSFEMVRRSVYSAVEMKVRHKKDHEAERGGAGGRMRYIWKGRG